MQEIMLLMFQTGSTGIALNVGDSDLSDIRINRAFCGDTQTWKANTLVIVNLSLILLES